MAIWIEKGVEYYPEDGTILLIRCPKCGKENYAPNVISGICTWCGANGQDFLKAWKEKNSK